MAAPDQSPSPLERFVSLEAVPAPPVEQSGPVDAWERLDVSANVADVASSSQTATATPEADDLPPPPIIVWGALPIRGEATETAPSDTSGKQVAGVGRWVGFRPAPRVFPDTVEDKLELWQPGPTADPPSLPYFFISVVVALLTGVGALVTGNGTEWRNQIQLGLTILFSGTVIQAAVTTVWQEVTYRRKMSERAQRYEKHLSLIRGRLDGLRSKQREVSLVVHPDPNECLQRVETRDRHLWERSLRDPDFLDLRLGMGGAPATFSLKGVSSPQGDQSDDPLFREGQGLVSQFSQHVDDVPIVAPISEIGIMGVAGEDQRLQRMVRALIVQLATHHSPDELKLVLSVPENDQRAWEWVRELPHAWNLDGSRCYLACNAVDARRDLELIGEQLKQKYREYPRDTRKVPPATLFLFADPDVVSQIAVQSRSSVLELILAQGTLLGAYAVFAAPEQQQFPSWCDDWVELTDAKACLHRAGPGRSMTEFTADGVDLNMAERFGRSVASLRYASRGG